MPEIRPPVAFRDAQFFTVRHALAVQPRLVVEANRVHDERVAVPLRNRISHPKRLEILRMAASIQKQLAIAMNVSLIQNHDELWSLNEFLGKWRNPRNARGQAMPFRIVFAQTGSPFLVERIGPWLQRNLSEGCEAETGIPYSREIDLAIG